MNFSTHLADSMRQTTVKYKLGRSGSLTRPLCNHSPPNSTPGLPPISLYTHSTPSLVQRGPIKLNSRYNCFLYAEIRPEAPRRPDPEAANRFYRRQQGGSKCCEQNEKRTELSSFRINSRAIELLRTAPLGLAAKPAYFRRGSNEDSEEAKRM